MNDIPYNRRAIAFMDILGMGSLVRRLEHDGMLLRNLHSVLVHIKNQERYANLDSTALSRMEVSVFSDCIAASIEPELLPYLIMICANLQNELLLQGVAVRGGITVERSYHANGVIFGAGIVRAYEIESREAVEPRIVLDDAIVKGLSGDLQRRFLRQDEDGRTFIMPMVDTPYIPGAEGLAAEGYDPRHAFLSEVRRHIVASLKEAAGDSKIHSKWLWLARKFNEAKARAPSSPLPPDIGV